MVWRLYRLPGSRDNWHIDTGPGTFVINAKQFEIRVRAYSVDVGVGNAHPHTWIEMDGETSELYLTEGMALWVAFAAPLQPPAPLAVESAEPAPVA